MSKRYWRRSLDWKFQPATTRRIGRRLVLFAPVHIGVAEVDSETCLRVSSGTSIVRVIPLAPVAGASADTTVRYHSADRSGWHRTGRRPHTGLAGRSIDACDPKIDVGVRVAEHAPNLAGCDPVVLTACIRASRWPKVLCPTLRVSGRSSYETESVPSQIWARALSNIVLSGYRHRCADCLPHTGLAGRSVRCANRR